MKHRFVEAFMAVLCASPFVTTAHADPITSGASSTAVVLPFSVRVFFVSGPTERLFGESVQVGDIISGRIVFDSTSVSVDLAGDPLAGNYRIFSGRAELDVPSELTWTTSVQPIFAFVENNQCCDAGNRFDSLGFAAETAAAGFATVHLGVGWTDLSSQVFDSDGLPLDPSILARMTFTSFQLQTLDEPLSAGIAVAARSESLDPVPEPATWLLLSSGAAYLLARRRRGGSAVE